MNAPAIIQTKNTITIVFHDPEYKSVCIDSSHPNFSEIRNGINNQSWEEVYYLIDIESSISKYTHGKIDIINGGVYYDGEQVHNTICERILEFMNSDIPFEPLLKFLENLMENPSFNSRNELYSFLENENLPITEDGMFLAYKAVRQDYMDIYSGTMSNKVGETVSMPRFKVDDNAGNGCSSGLHAGSIDYVKSYGGYSSRTLIVKINPKDVVSVPNEDHRKLRCSQYEVVSEFRNVLNDPLYNSDASSSHKKTVNQEYYDDSYDDLYEWD